MPTEKNAAFLPRQWGFKLDRQRVKLFHTLSAAWIGLLLTAGCLQLLRNMSGEFISHVMKFTWYGKMVLRTAWRILQKWVCKAFSALAALYWTRWELHRNMRYRNKVHILSYMCLVSFWYLVWEWTEMWRHYFLNTLHMYITVGCFYQTPCSLV